MKKTIALMTIAATIADIFSVDYKTQAQSLFEELRKF